MKKKKQNNPMAQAYSPTHLTVAQWAKRERRALRSARSSVAYGKLSRLAEETMFNVVATGIPKDVKWKDL